MEIQITKEEFEKCIKDLKKLSDQIHDNWLHHEGNDSTYLSRKSSVVFNNELITLDHHIVYNLSYGTPMLCFNVWKSTGALLSLEECWELLNIHQDENRLSILTQMDHPVLQRPFFGLHPCKTPEILSSTFDNSKNIVVSWLSTVGPNVKLELDLIYATLTNVR